MIKNKKYLFAAGMSALLCLFAVSCNLVLSTSETNTQFSSELIEESLNESEDEVKEESKSEQVSSQADTSESATDYINQTEKNTENPIENKTETQTDRESNPSEDTTLPPEAAYKTESLGLFELTAYCPCEKCCGIWAQNRPTDENGKPIVYTSSGDIAKEGITIAADISKYPFGTNLLIGDTIYTVQDRGSAIVGNRLDIYFESHQAALEFGRQKDIEVFFVIWQDGSSK